MFSEKMLVDQKQKLKYFLHTLKFWDRVFVDSPLRPEIPAPTLQLQSPERWNNRCGPQHPAHTAFVAAVAAAVFLRILIDMITTQSLMTLVIACLNNRAKERTRNAGISNASGLEMQSRW